MNDRLQTLARLLLRQAETAADLARRQARHADDTVAKLERLLRSWQQEDDVTKGVADPCGDLGPLFGGLSRPQVRDACAAGAPALAREGIDVTAALVRVKEEEATGQPLRQASREPVVEVVREWWVYRRNTTDRVGAVNATTGPSALALAIEHHGPDVWVCPAQVAAWGAAGQGHVTETTHRPGAERTATVVQAEDRPACEQGVEEADCEECSGLGGDWGPGGKDAHGRRKPCPACGKPAHVPPKVLCDHCGRPDARQGCYCPGCLKLVTASTQEPWQVAPLEFLPGKWAGPLSRAEVRTVGDLAALLASGRRSVRGVPAKALEGPGGLLACVRSWWHEHTEAGNRGEYPGWLGRPEGPGCPCGERCRFGAPVAEQPAAPACHESWLAGSTFDVTLHDGQVVTCTWDPDHRSGTARGSLVMRGAAISPTGYRSCAVGDSLRARPLAEVSRELAQERADQEMKSAGERARPKQPDWSAARKEGLASGVAKPRRKRRPAKPAGTLPGESAGEGGGE